MTVESLLSDDNSARLQTNASAGSYPETQGVFLGKEYVYLIELQKHRETSRVIRLDFIVFE